MRLIIAGSRRSGQATLGNVQSIDLAFSHFITWEQGPIPWPTVVISGKAPGPDTDGERWAEAHGIVVEPYPARWYPGGRFDPDAGKKRNAQMVAVCDGLLALWDRQSSGTRDVIIRAQQHNKPVWVWDLTTAYPMPTAKHRDLDWVKRRKSGNE